MHKAEEIAFPFTIPNWWKTSAFSSVKGKESGHIDYFLPPLGTLLDEISKPSTYVSISDSLTSDGSGVLSDGYHDLEITPIPLETHEPPLEDVELSEDLASSSLVGSLEELQLPDVDLWTSTEPDIGDKSSKLRTWAAFQAPSISEQRTTFLSDRGIVHFDSNIGPREGPGISILYANAIKCLIHLGLGRPSALFRFDPSRQLFVIRQKTERFLGHSLETSLSYVRALAEGGINVRNLRNLLHTATAHRHSSRSMIALISEATTFLASAEASLISNSTKLRSLLDVQNLFESYHQNITFLSDVVSQANAAESQNEMLLRIWKALEMAEEQSIVSGQVIVQIWKAIARPWLADMMIWIGLEKAVATNNDLEPPTFVRIPESGQDEDADWGHNDSNDERNDQAPASFISAADSRLAHEIGSAVRLLRTHQPAHPILSCSQRVEKSMHDIACDFSWSSFEAVVDRANRYEREAFAATLLYEIQPVTDQKTDSDQSTAKDLASLAGPQSNISDSIALIERPLRLSKTAALVSVGPEEASTQVLSLQSSDFGPPFSMLPTLSITPWLTSQNRLVNRACLKMMLNDFDAVSHFRLLYRYYLLGDEFFSFRLCQALFDPALASAERIKGAPHLGQILGLRLGHRSIWPPASSELRVALMGILSDSYLRSSKVRKPYLSHTDLPGGLSFAIRKISEAEIQKCTNADSIWALDFLQLQYKAPPPLHVLITDKSLLKYDAIFGLLLRAKRMLFVVDHLDSRLPSRHPHSMLWFRSRMEARHFVHCICTYFFESITKHWGLLTSELDRVHQSLRSNSSDIGTTLTTLRKFHDTILNDIMRILFLRKSQSQVRGLLEEAFEVVLKLDTISQTICEQDSQAMLEDVRENLSKKVKLFLRFCRSLKDKIALDGERTAGGSVTSCPSEPKMDGHDSIAVGQLLLRFEMNDYYG